MMFLHRFFINQSDVKNNKVSITGKDYKHISKALRLESGDKIVACTGDGYDLIVELDEFTSEKVIGNIINREKSKGEPDHNITVAQAIPKKRNMELVVQKTTEIGVKKIIPLKTKRTVVKLKGKKEKKRIGRWQRIAEEAAKQSQRGIIPKIEKIFSIKELKNLKNNYDLVIVLWASEDRKILSEILSDINSRKDKNILLIIGPEGGFSKKEIEIMENELRAQSVTLGSRILRTETAPIVGLSIILYELGDLGG